MLDFLILLVNSSVNWVEIKRSDEYEWPWSVQQIITIWWHFGTYENFYIPERDVYAKSGRTSNGFWADIKNVLYNYDSNRCGLFKGGKIGWPGFTLYITIIILRKSCQENVAGFIQY